MSKSKKTPVIDYALKYIYRYPKTEKELRVRLLEKHYSEEEVEEAINYLKKQGRLDDRKFAQMYIESELVKKGKPLILVKQNLLKKGVSKDIVDEVISEKIDEIEEGIINKIKKEIERLKVKGKDGFDIIQTLARRGYSLKYIKKAINNLENDL